MVRDEILDDLVVEMTKNGYGASVSSHVHLFYVGC